MKHTLFLLPILLLFLTACSAEIGETCSTAFVDFDCVTDNCVDNICTQSEAGGKCSEQNHCTQGYCILGVCSPQSELDGLCENDFHCAQGVCKGYKCQLGDKGDMCSLDTDCKEGTACYGGHCVENNLWCQIARGLKLNSIGMGWGILLILLGFIGGATGIAIPGITVEFKGINIILSIIAFGAGLLIVGVGIGSACF